MNNSKILLSSITISILCSVNLSAACPNGTESGDTCTISGATINDSVTPWHNRNPGGDSIGKTLIIENGTHITQGNQKSTYAGSVRNGKADENTLIITGGSVLNVEYVSGGKVNNPIDTSSASNNSVTISGANTQVTSKHILSGGWTAGEGTANENIVTIKEGATV
ncbi:MAG: hypothetical protein MSH23_00430, partial [Campylobacter lanienae]|uniref:hypothetical protein n=1 Tax=Campylobacter lanienae TaxID=75658 RepID=UPI00242F8DAD